MKKGERLARWLARRGCSETHLEEMEGDLLEIFAARERQSLRHRRRGLIWEALRMVLGCPSESLRRWVYLLALIFAGTGVAFAYAVLFMGSAERIVLSWPVVLFGVVFELLFWCLLLGMVRKDVEQSA